MKSLRLMLALGAMLFAAACLPVTSKAPVGTTAGLGADPALIGTWKPLPEKETLGEADDIPGYFHFVADKDGTMRVVIVGTGKDATTHGSWSVYAVSSTQLGGHTYLNTRALYDDGEAATGAENTIPMLYRFGDDGTLIIAMLGEDATKAAIKAGKIEGLTGEGDSSDVMLTAAPEKLDAFFATEEGAALFTEKLVVLKRI